MAKVQVIRRPERFLSDDSRVIAHFLDIGDPRRAKAIIARVLALDEPQVHQLYQRVMEEFAHRHRRLEGPLERHFGYVRHLIADPDALTHERRMLIGSYFTMEYAIESAALFNPSIVPHPDQGGVGEGAVRFIMSLRATGEGHVSSIVFRTGIISGDGSIDFDPPSRFCAKLRVKPDRNYEKKLFFLKLIEMAAYNDAARVILEQLPESFTLELLLRAVDDVRKWEKKPPNFNATAENMLWLARSNYHLHLPPDTDPSEIVIFPVSENESRGIEDARLTRFTEDDGQVTYIGTYTAYNGFNILPQIFETRNFLDFEVHTLNGRYVQNKGMALFPRRIDGLYHMLSRIDGENLYLMRSDNIHFWNECRKLQGPAYPWELLQIGNCGPPIETPAGWLMLTHGVGPMRQYCIGCSLLDLEDPRKVIGHLSEPLIAPLESERDGYVPNVVYSCGAMIHGDRLVIPYAMSDSATSVATVSVSELLSELTTHSPSCPLPAEAPRRRRRIRQKSA